MGRVIFLLMLLLPLYAAAEQPLTPREKGLLWRITAPGQSPSYLFGTIHSEDSRVLTLSAKVEASLQDTSHFVMELVPDAAISQRLSERMMLPAGQHLAELMTPPLFKQTQRAAVAHGIPAEAVERMKPWALMMILSMPNAHTGHYLDQQLYERAVAAGKQTSALETVDEQIDALDHLSIAVQLELLRHALEQYDELPELTEQLLDAWLRGDLETLHQLGELANAGLPEATAQTLQWRLIEQRNLRMAERLAPLLKQGGVFVAVGALHLPGEKGLIALLREQGFAVQPLP